MVRYSRAIAEARAQRLREYNHEGLSLICDNPGVCSLTLRKSWVIERMNPQALPFGGTNFTCTVNRVVTSLG
jgi:hypothetical protein